MRCHRWCALTVSVLFGCSVAACSGTVSSTAGSTNTPVASSSSPVSTSSSTTAPSTSLPTPTKTSALGRAKAETIPADAAPPSPAGGLEQSAATQQYVATTTQQALNYWADDWCHYYASNGVWYGDYCVRSFVDESGQIVPNVYLIYVYDQYAAGHLGAMVRYLNVGVPGWVAYRDFNDPHFQQIVFAAYPSNAQVVTLENTVYYLGMVDGRAVWRNATAFTFTAPGIAGQPLRVPAWDPSITVQSYSLYSQINNNLQKIPGSSY